MKSRIDVIGHNGPTGEHYDDKDNFGIPEHLRSLHIRDDEPNDTGDVSTSALGKLVDDHWAYVENLLFAHAISKNEMDIAEFHYKSAFVHGYKHALEDL